MLAEKTDGSVALSKENLASLKKQLSSFSQTFTNEDFREVYDTKNTLDAEVLEYVKVLHGGSGTDQRMHGIQPPHS